MAEVESSALARIVEGRVRTVAQFRPVVARAVARCDTRRFEDKHRDAVAQRRISWRFHPATATTDLYALDLPADEAARLIGTLAAGARAPAVLPDGSPDPRTADQRRADALLDLAGGRAAAGSTTDRPSVGVLVNASTLLGLDELPAVLEGHGPIPASMARAIADDPTARWQRILTDPCGAPVEVGDTYRPARRLARLVVTRDRTCRFPGCRRRANSCELDHVVAHQDGGPTGEANLHALCARHHHLKHEAPGWTVHRRDDGTTRWRTPTGRVIDVPPEPYDDVPDAWRPPDRDADLDRVAPLGGYDPTAPIPLLEPPDLDDRDARAA